MDPTKSALISEDDVHAASVDSPFVTQEKLMTSPSPSKFSRLGLQICLNVLSLLLFAVVIVFVQATDSAESKSDKKLALNGLDKIDVSTTLTVVRASQGVLAAISAITLKQALFLLQWILMARQPSGMPYLSALALSPTTAFIGTFLLLKNKAAKLGAKIWGLSRTTLTGFLFLAGPVLFFSTSLVTIYDTADTYDVTAGVGPFNASLVEPFLALLQSTAPSYPYAILPFSYFAAVFILIADPLISSISEPVMCTGTANDCSSFLFTGGLNMVAPWSPQTYQEHPMIKVDHVPAMQLDFQGSVSSTFADEDCDVFGGSGFAIGIRLCLTQDSASYSTIRAGLFVCNNGTDGGICHTSTPAPNITSTLAYYTRKATFVAARSNYSIVSIADTTDPVPLASLDLPSYRLALSWLLNYTAAGIPASSSIAQTFWSGQANLKTGTYGVLAQNFQSILAFPTWLFNANNWGNTALRANEIIPGMPPEFYTEASIVSPHVKIRFDAAMFALFVAFQGVVLLLCWGVLVWAWFDGDLDGVPVTSSFPVFDMAFKVAIFAGQDAVGQKSALRNADSSKVLSVMSRAQAHTKVE